MVNELRLYNDNIRNMPISYLIFKNSFSVLDIPLTFNSIILTHVLEYISNKLYENK